MNTLRVIILNLIFFVSFPYVYAQPFNMILSGDPALEDLRFLTLETGKPFLSFAPPLSPDEIRIYLDSINEASLSHPAREAYYRLISRLNPSANISLSSGNFTYHVEINASLEGRIRFNEDILWHPLNEEISKLLTFPMQLFFSDTLQLYFEPHFSIKPMDRNYREMFFINIPENVGAEYYPVRSFAAIGGSWWNFHIGRDHLNWGTSHTGSLTFTDNDVLYDLAKLSVFAPDIKYTVLINQMPIKLTPALFTDNYRQNNPDDTYFYTKIMQRYFYLHRIDVSLFGKLSISYMEGVLIGNSPLELRFLNPLLIFHSLYTWNDYGQWPQTTNNAEESGVGSILSLEINWNIYNSLAFYGQFVMTQFALQGELNHDPDQPPDGLGYLAGFHYSHSFGAWGSVFYLEFIYTAPYLYISSSSISSLIQMDYVASSYPRYYLTGYQRDTIALTLGAKFFKNDELSFTGSFAWIASGQFNKDNHIAGLTWDYEHGIEGRSKKTPSGITEHNFILSIEGRWRIYPFLTVKSNIVGIYSINNNHNLANNQLGGQTSFNAVFSY